jgi:hypothetical protein
MHRLYDRNLFSREIDPEASEKRRRDDLNAFRPTDDVLRYGGERLWRAISAAIPATGKAPRETLGCV